MKLNWFKLVQICLNLNQESKKCIFLVKNAPKRDFLAFLKLLGDVVGEECLSPAEACLPLPFPIGIPELTPYYIQGNACRNSPPFSLMECGSLPPLMSVFITDTAPMRQETCLVLNGVSGNINPLSANFNRLGIYVLYYLLVLLKTSESVPVVSMRSVLWDSRAFCKALKLCQISQQYQVYTLFS